MDEVLNQRELTTQNYDFSILREFIDSHVLVVVRVFPPHYELVEEAVDFTQLVLR